VLPGDHRVHLVRSVGDARPAGPEIDSLVHRPEGEPPASGLSRAPFIGAPKAIMGDARPLAPPRLRAPLTEREAIVEAALALVTRVHHAADADDVTDLEPADLAATAVTRPTISRPGMHERPGVI
jgi:hypothetical protein